MKIEDYNYWIFVAIQYHKNLSYGCQIKNLPLSYPKLEELLKQVVIEDKPSISISIAYNGSYVETKDWPESILQNLKHNWTVISYGWYVNIYQEKISYR